MTELKPLKMEQVYWLCEKAGLIKEAEFVKGFLIKYDVIKNNNKVKRGTPIQGRKSVKVL
jgi:hypothetical protein